jgi:hypothetical protein
MPRPERHDGARQRLEAAPERRLEPFPEELDVVLRERSVVDQAVGMLMAYYGLAAPAAVATLKRWAESSDLSLVHLATGVVEAGSQPSVHPFGALSRMLRGRTVDVDVGPALPPETA